MLVTSIFSFSKNVFYRSQKKFQFLVALILSSAICLNLVGSKLLSFGKELNSQTLGYNPNVCKNLSTAIPDPRLFLQRVETKISLHICAVWSCFPQRLNHLFLSLKSIQVYRSQLKSDCQLFFNSLPHNPDF